MTGVQTCALPIFSQTNLDLNPTELLFGQGIYDTLFDSYSIKLSTRIPDTDYINENQVLPTINIGTNAYYDGENLIIEFDNMNTNEFIEIQIMSNATIYTMRENDY